MKKFLTLVLITFITIGCGKISVGDSKHTVVHTIDLGPLLDDLERLCTDRYSGAPDAVSACVSELADTITRALSAQEARGV